MERVVVKENFLEEEMPDLNLLRMRVKRQETTRSARLEAGEINSQIKKGLKYSNKEYEHFLEVSER